MSNKIDAGPSPIADASARACATCALWSHPAWDTRGFGTCATSELRGVVQVVGNGYVATHESHACAAWKGSE